MGVRAARRGAGPLLLDRGADVADRRTRGIHLLRIARHVEAHGAVRAVRFPFHDVARAIAPGHETILVALVPRAFAPAEAGDITEYFGMLRSEDVRGSNNIGRPRWCVRLERKRWQVRLFVWFERNRRWSLGRIRTRRGSGRSGFGGCDIADAAGVREHRN